MLLSITIGILGRNLIETDFFVTEKISEVLAFKKAYLIEGGRVPPELDLFQTRKQRRLVSGVLIN
ncbi:hypothetical protein VCR29J2_1010056 [Vibrio coralliirubri]|nr:hypothetical protein VCR29J2_1010056 [Vibrio coralliirubri]